MLKNTKKTVKFILKNLGLLLVLFILFFYNNGLRAEEGLVGFVDTLEGTAHKINGDSTEPVELKEFDQIFVKEKIKLDKGSSVIISFTDNSLLTLKDESEFFIEKFDKTSSKPTFILSIPKGKFSFESGSISKHNEGVMKIKLSGMDVKLNGTLAVGVNTGGTKSVTLVEDSMGKLGSLEVGIEGSNETKTITESASGVTANFSEEEQQQLDAGNYETTETSFEETQMSEEERNEVVEENKEVAVQSATQSEEKIERQLQKKLADGTIPDANGDGVADLADVEAFKAELLEAKEAKLEYLVQESSEDLSVISEIIVNSESETSMLLMENLMETNANSAALLMTEIVEQEFDIFSHVAQAETGNFEALRETIVNEMIQDENDYVADTMAQMMAVGDASMSEYMINEITNIEPTAVAGENLAMDVLATFTEVASDKMTKFFQEDPNMMNNLASYAFENATEDHVDMISDMMQETPGQNTAYLMASMVEHNAEMIADVYVNLAEQDFDLFNHIEEAREDPAMMYGQMPETDPYAYDPYMTEPDPYYEDPYAYDPYMAEPDPYYEDPYAYDPYMPEPDSFMPMPGDPFMPMPGDPFMPMPGGDMMMMMAQDQFFDSLKGEIFSEIINHSEGTAAEVTADLMMNSGGDSAMFMMETMMYSNPELVSGVMQSFVEEDFDIFEHFEEPTYEEEYPGYIDPTIGEMPQMEFLPDDETATMPTDDPAETTKSKKGSSKEERQAAKAERKAEKEIKRAEKKAARQAKKEAKKLERQRKKEEKKLARQLKKEQSEMGMDMGPMFDMNDQSMNQNFAAVQDMKTNIISEMIMHGDENTMDTMAQMIAVSDDADTSALIFETVMEQSELLETMPTESFESTDNLSLELLSSLNEVQPEIMDTLYEEQSYLMEEVIEDAFTEVSFENIEMVSDIIGETDNSMMAAAMFENMSETAEMNIISDVFENVASDAPEMLIAMAETDQELYENISMDIYATENMSAENLVQDIYASLGFVPAAADTMMMDPMEGMYDDDDPYMTDMMMADPYMADPYMMDPYMMAGPYDPYNMMAGPYDPYMMAGPYDPYAYDPYAYDPYAYDPYMMDPYYDDDDDDDTDNTTTDCDGYATCAERDAALAAANQPYWVTYPFIPAASNYAVGSPITAINFTAESSPMSHGVNYTATGLPPGLDISGSTISGTPTDDGSYTATVRVEDAVDSTRFILESIYFTIDEAASPNWITYPMAMGPYTVNTVISPITFRAESSPIGNGVTYSATGLPEGIDISGSTISGTPTDDGSYTADIIATDNQTGADTSYSLMFDIDPAGPLAWSTTPYAMGPFYVGTPISFTFLATSGYSITYGDSGLPDGLTRTGNTVSGTPTDQEDYTATITASDGVATSLSETLTFNIEAAQPLSWQTSPFIPAASNYTVGSPITAISFLATSGYSITYGDSGLPDGLTRTGTTISGTPTEDGSFSATITANDGNATPLSQTLYFNIYPAAAPTWITAPIAMGPYTQGDTINIDFEAESTPMAAGNTITYRYTGTLPSGLSFDTSDGEITGVPDTQESSYVTVYATDSVWGSETSGTMLTFLIRAAAAPTWVYYPGSETTVIGDAYSETLNATSVSGSVTFSSNDLPPGLSISGSTISGTFENFGNYTATITATDSVYNTSSSQMISYNIDPTNPAAMNWYGETPAEGSLGNFNVNDYINYTFEAQYGVEMGGGMWSYSSMNTRYQLTGSLPSGVTWQTIGGYSANNPTTMMGAAAVRGYAPSQAIESDYPFTIRAYNINTYVEASPQADSYNDRDFEITILEDPTCLSPVNNVCT